MTRKRFIQAALFLLAGIAACALVKRPQPVTFSHALHVEEQGVECSSCHGDVAEADDLKQRRLPGVDACKECHEDEDDAGRVASLALASYTPPRIYVPEFSHSLHVGLDEIDGKCAPCHAMGDATRSAAANRHKLCMECHREQFRDQSCRVCHADFAIDAPYPDRYFAHTGDFGQRHGVVAKGNEMVCEHCHSPGDCATCHSARHVDLVPSVRNPSAVERPYIHRAGFLARHAIEARQDQTACLRCHQTNQCSDCHAQRGVAAGGGRTSPHPAGWMQPGARSFHGRDARRDIVSCATCHDQGPSSNCITCHRVGGVGGSPHPPGWSSRLDRNGDKTCRVCHTR